MQSYKIELSDEQKQIIFANDIEEAYRKAVIFADDEGCYVAAVTRCKENYFKNYSKRRTVAPQLISDVNQCLNRVRRH